MDISMLSLGDLTPDPITGEQMNARDKHNFAVECAIASEAAGLYGYYVGEHHGIEYVFSAPPVILAAIAQRTTTLRLGTGTSLLANLDPVRVAEDYATVDILSNGRLEIVGGRGNTFPIVYELLGQSLEDSHALFEENVRLLLEIWTHDRLTWEGRYRPAIRDHKIEPPALQQPHPPIWIGGGYPRRRQSSAPLSGFR